MIIKRNTALSDKGTISIQVGDGVVTVLIETSLVVADYRRDIFSINWTRRAKGTYTFPFSRNTLNNGAGDIKGEAIGLGLNRATSGKRPSTDVPLSRWGAKASFQINCDTRVPEGISTKLSGLPVTWGGYCTSNDCETQEIKSLREHGHTCCQVFLGLDTGKFTDQGKQGEKRQQQTLFLGSELLL